DEPGEGHTGNPVHQLAQDVAERRSVITGDRSGLVPDGRALHEGDHAIPVEGVIGRDRAAETRQPGTLYEDLSGGDRGLAALRELGRIGGDGLVEGEA